MTIEHSPTMAVLPELYAAVRAALAGDATALSGFGSQPPPRASGANVAVIPVTGIITPNPGLAKMLGGTATSDVRDQFDDALADPYVPSIVLAFSTPAGYADA